MIVTGFSPVLAQTFHGFPLIENYSPEEYNGSVQNWAFSEDSNGVLFLSNVQVIKKYDGVNWLPINVPNSRTYSIHSAADGRLYVGGVNEIGYLDAPTDSSTAIEQYYSLRYLIPDSIEFGRVFDVTSAGNDIYFQSNEILIRYDGSEVDYFEPSVRFSSTFNKDGVIYVREALEGIKEVTEDSLILIPRGDYFAEKNLISYLKVQNKDVFCAYNKCAEYRDNEFLELDMEVDSYLSEFYMDEAIVLQDESIVFATRLGGIVHTNSKGDILNIITEETGLISNTVYGVYEDRYGSVWAATINGLSRIDFGLPLRVFDERSGINEGIMSVSKYNDKLVFGSSTAVYHTDRSGSIQKFTMGGICSDLKVFSSKLFAACAERMYAYNGSDYDMISVPGTYKMALYDDPNMVVMSSSQGFYVGTLDGDQFEQLYAIENLSSVPTSLLVDAAKNVWVSTKIGVYRVVLEWEGDRVTGHTVEQYLVDQINISDDKRTNVTQLQGEPAFLTWGKGIQRFDEKTGSMYQEMNLPQMFTDTTRQYYFANEDAEGNIWLRSGGDYQGALKNEEGSYQVLEGPLKLVDYNQNNLIFTGDDDHVWYGTEQGAIRYSKNHNFDHTASYHTQINEVLVRNDSLINGGQTEEAPVLKYMNNELRFTYAAASYFAPEETEYRVKLSGFDEDWSIWSSEAQKDYTNIPEGSYSFAVQARNVFGVMSESEIFEFKILPPWYRTWWAYLLYSLTIAGILYTAYRIRVNQLLRVERIRNNIASDLHDEVSATLSSISYFAQAIQSDKVTGDKNRFVRLIADSAGDAKEKITDIVWAINPEHDDWTGFLSKCRRYASDLLESKNISYSLKITEHIPGKLDMQLRQHLWLIFKEMVTNAARHSEANNLDIIIKFKDGMFSLVVQDDGTGMDVDGVKKGNGLININKRAELIGAEVDLRTSEGFGTRWKLNVRV
ncbi:MAG: hypothetical protein CL666_06590 [Balneola sp.]|nr:hypothetical protein [Balneola sp.]